MREGGSEGGHQIAYRGLIHAGNARMFASSTPIPFGLPLTAVTATSQKSLIPLSAIPLSAIPLSAIPLSAIPRMGHSAEASGQRVEHRNAS